MTRKDLDTGRLIGEHLRSMLALLSIHQKKRPAGDRDGKRSKDVTVEVDRENDRSARVGYLERPT